MMAEAALTVEVIQAGVLALIFLRLGKVIQRTDSLGTRLDTAAERIDRLSERLREVEMAEGEG